MKFKTRKLSLENKIGFHATIDSEKDVFDQVADASMFFKELLIQNGFYTNGPIMFEFNPFNNSLEIELFTTIGNVINIVGKNESNIEFEKHFEFTTEYVYRHFDQEKEIPYDEIKEKIEKNGQKLNTFYHVLLDFYGDTVVDLYCEVL